MKRVLSVAIAVLLVLPSLGAAAKPYPHKSAQAQVDIPDDWKVEVTDDPLSAETKDGNLWVGFNILEAKDLEKAFKELDKELGKLMKKMTYDKPEDVEVNGMKGFTCEGKGQVEGNDVDFGTMVLVTPSGKVLLAIGFGATGKYEQHQPALTKIFTSIRTL